MESDQDVSEFVRDDPWWRTPCLYSVNDHNGATASEIKTNSKSEYSHRFGGKPCHTGVIPCAGSRPLHLLYSFDLNDPNIPLELPGLTRLPLYSAIASNYSSLHYRIISDSKIQILDEETIESDSELLYPEYPIAFPELPVEVTDPDPISLDKIGISQYEGQRLLNPSSPVELTTDELVQVHARIANPLNISCANEECRSPDFRMLAAFHDNWMAKHGIHVWDEEDEFVVMMYWICYSCLTVSTHNCPN